MKIRGLKIEIGADASGVTQALDKINGNLNFTERQLKDINKLLKFDPKNTELLAQKHKMVASEIDLIKNKMEKLKQLEKEIANQPGQETKWQAVKREIIDAENKLKKYTDTHKQTLIQMSKMQSVSSGLKNVSNGFDTLGKKTRALSAAAAGGIVALGGMAIKSSELADELLTLSTQTGLSTDTIQQMKYSAELLDVSFETVQKSLARTAANLNKLQKGSKETQDVFIQLGVNAQDVNGHFKSTEQVFYELVDAMGQVEDTTQREMLATQLFGKSYQELMPLIEQGSGAFKEHAKDAKNILPNETLKKLGEFDDTMQKIKADTAGIFAEVGAEVAISLKPALEQGLKIVRDLATWFKNLDPNMQSFIGVTLLATAALSPFASGISLVIGGISSLIGWIVAKNAAVTAETGLTLAQNAANIITTASTWALNAAMIVLTSPIFLVVAAIAALIAIGVLLWQNWDTVMEWAGKTWDFIVNVFKGAASWFNDTVVRPISDFFSGLWNGISNMTSNAWNGIMGLFNSGGDIFNGIVNGVGDLFKWIINNFIKGINYVISMPFRNINTILGAIRSVNIMGFQPFSWIGSIPVPQIPQLSIGTNEVYKDGLAVIHKGEAVVPAHVAKGGFKTGTQELNVNIPFFLDKKLIGKAVATVVSDYQGLRLKKMQGV